MCLHGLELFSTIYCLFIRLVFPIFTYLNYTITTHCLTLYNHSLSQLCHPFTKPHWSLCRFTMPFLPSIYSASVKFSKSPFLIIYPSNFIFLLLILNFYIVLIFIKFSSLFQHLSGDEDHCHFVSS